MFKYPPPSGYRIPGQPFSRFGYDGELWLPASVGPKSGLLPANRVLSLPPSQGLTFWFDARRQSFSDSAGTVSTAAPFGRVARVNQPNPAPAGASDSASGPNFQVDHLHPTNAGQALQAVPWQAAIATVLAQP